MVDHAQTQYASKQMISGANVDEHTSRETALVAARAADDRKADNIPVFPKLNSGEFLKRFQTK
jgi:ribosome-associated protein